MNFPKKRLNRVGNGAKVLGGGREVPADSALREMTEEFVNWYFTEMPGNPQR